MRYLLLIHSDESYYAQLTPADYDALMADYTRFTEELEASGKFIDGARLRPSETAKTVRLREGDRLVTDGPFAETKEQLGGFYLIEADSEAEALEWGAKIPTAKYGSIEVRPEWDTDEA